MANKGVNPFKEIRIKAGDQARSIAWYRSQIKKVGDTRFKPSELVSNRELRTRKLDTFRGSPFGLYFFYYDPKFKNELPYYDTFPLVYPFRYAENGFYGYNLHYLPPSLRFKLMGALIDIRIGSPNDEERQTLQSVGLLNQEEVNAYFAPCIKRYLNTHVRSTFIRIPDEDWVAASMLPVQNFQKASDAKVWSDSRKIIRGY